GSILGPLVNEGRHVDPGSWLVEGIGEDCVPSICDLKLVSKAYTVSDGDAFHTARELLRKEGVLAGSRVGTLLCAALRYCREQREPKRVVTFICDSGAKYLSKMFNDFWMVDNGFIDRPKTGDLRDLIARRHLDREDYTLTTELPLQQAIKRMRLYNVSQMVVLGAGGAVEGIIDESDVLLAMVDDPKGSATRPVSDFMTRRIETLRPSAKVTDLLPIFRADRVAIVADEKAFYGIITKIDLINYLRKQLL
ncbi:MAG: pyridoxal-phosphate dependent enzyme, partial [Phycisphaerales bacterium]